MSPTSTSVEKELRVQQKRPNDCHIKIRNHGQQYSMTNDGFYLEDSFETPDYYGKQYFATCIPGLASTLANELINIGASNVEISGSSGVIFYSSSDDDVDIGMKAVMYVRTAHRIMELISTSSPSYYDGVIVNSRDSLYSFIQSNTPVQSLLGDGKGGLLTLSVNVILNGKVPKDLCHSHYTALTVKNALVDLVRDLRDDGIRPDVDIDDPDVPLMVVLKGNGGSNDNNRGYDYNDRNDRRRRDDFDENVVDVSFYRVLHAGGSSLHRRGYRSSSAIHKAAMKESMAAGLLLEAGWDKLCQAAREKDGLPAVLVDPMAGSGTFCVEAALIASDYAPGLMRMRCYDSNSKSGENANKWNPHHIPPVLRWKDSKKDYWKKLVIEARDRAASGMDWMNEKNPEYPDLTNCVILANEMNGSAADLATSNIVKAGFEKYISLNEGDCINWDIESSVIPGRTIVVSNPPWGLRLTEDVEESWLSLKAFLRDQCNESEAWVLSGSKDATRYLRMKKTRSVVIKTAGEDLRWIQYHVFKKKAPTMVD